MRKLTFFIAALVFTISGCDNKADADADADAARQAKLKDTYRVPPPSDPAEDQWAKSGTTKPKPKGQ